MAKKPKPKPKPKKSSKGVVIQLKAGIGPDPNPAQVKKNKPGGPGDRVRWWNRTKRGHTITIDVWPFVEPPQPIMVAAGAKSPWFTIFEDTPSSFYDYSIEPTINPSSGPPGDPGMLVGD